MTQTANFSVTGEFITNLARTWFWDENKPLQTCIELLECCIQSDDENIKQTIIQQILEGRKKFVGTNEFELVDDNKNIRPIINKLTQKQKERKAEITKIQLEMITDFTKYVDRWSTVKSTRPDIIAPYDIITYKAWTKWLTTTWGCRMDYDEPITGRDKNNKEILLFDTHTRGGGVWLIDHPELCYDCCNGDLHQIGSQEFWKNIYEWTKDKPKFESRNQHYKFSIRPKPSLEERMENLTKAYQEKTAKNPENEPEFLSKEWFHYQ